MARRNIPGGEYTSLMSGEIALTVLQCENMIECLLDAQKLDGRVILCLSSDIVEMCAKYDRCLIPVYHYLITSSNTPTRYATPFVGVKVHHNGLFSHSEKIF